MTDPDSETDHRGASTEGRSGPSEIDEFEEAARALESRDVLSGTFEVNDEEHPLRVLEPTLDELEELEEEAPEDADEVDIIRDIADQYLEAPDVNVGDLGVSKLYALFDGMRDTWSDSDVMEEAREEMPVDQQGNSRRSRR